MMLKLVVGCGYLGRRVARHWLAAGDTVVAVTRSPERASRFDEEGIRPILADVTRPETLADLPTAHTVLYAVGYDRRERASRREVYVDGLRAVLSALPAETGRIMFTSSTGVYGQTDGSWVDEDSPCQPTREGGRLMLGAEQVLGGHPLGPRAVILRLAGLYGPGRVPRMADLLAGRPVAAPAHGYLNLIHVNDAARAVLAAEALATPPRRYIISDGHPTQRRYFYAFLGELLGRPCPRFVDPAPDDRAALRATANRRARNARMLSELRVTLAYPSYREGLAAIVAHRRP